MAVGFAVNLWRIRFPYPHGFQSWNCNPLLERVSIVFGVDSANQVVNPNSTAAVEDKGVSRVPPLYSILRGRTDRRWYEVDPPE